VRPSYVLGGRAMEIVYDEEDLRATCARRSASPNEAPVLLDRFLDDAIEVDVDAVCRRRAGGDRRHHGAHRAGRRALRRLRLLPAALHLPAAVQDEMREQMRRLAWRWACAD
jgi:biotin carboxylase